MKQKKLMLLGGLRYLLPVIESAHQLGYYVITCDNIPDNIAHKYSDEYYNVSIIDREAVLNLAQKLQIDGIMSFAVDPGVITAAYVQEQMKLPGNPYESVLILQNKDRFRNFLAEHGFNVPESKSFSSVEEALSMKSWYSFPVIVKPTDSAGSKGVTKVESFEQLEKAFYYAMEYSISKRVIVEEFIEQDGYSSDSDCFSIDGKLKFISFSSQYFDNNASNPYVPSAYSWPSLINQESEMRLTLELQRLLSLLDMRTSLYNVETRIGKNGKVYIMEVSPRGGGNRLSEMLKYATGVDLITNAVCTAVGDKVIRVEQQPYNGYWAEIILHSSNDGIFERLYISEEIRPYVVEEDLWINFGDKVTTFNGANNAIGTLVLKFSTQQELEDVVNNSNRWLKIEVA